MRKKRICEREAITLRELAIGLKEASHLSPVDPSSLITCVIREDRNGTTAFSWCAMRLLFPQIHHRAQNHRVSFPTYPPITGSHPFWS
jgi:hypothetical protein